jgi:caa(3)-type oxidase subunit IV
MTEVHHFNSTRIFFTLFVLTAVEVTWSFIPFPKWALWGGLLVFAFWKGLLIFTYFMHMKFEGWVVKALIAPTPVLIAIVVFAITPDVARNDQLIEPVGSQIDPVTGRVVENMGARDGQGGGHGGGDKGEAQGH